MAPIALWKRAACVGMALAGLAAIYFTQVRSMLIITAGCLAVIVALLEVILLIAYHRSFLPLFVPDPKADTKAL